MKIKLKNISQVPVLGKLPGAEFRVDAVNASTPADVFWRKRLKDNDGIIVVKDNVPETKRETLKLEPSKRAEVEKKIKQNPETKEVANA